MDAGITLAEALEELRRELYAAQDAGAGQQLRFEVEQAQLTLDVEFHRNGDGRVKVEVGLPGAKAGGEASGGSGSTRRQTLTLTLQVHDEALGGSRARIRRPSTDGAGAVVSPFADAEPKEGTAQDSSAVEPLQKRPWER
ncbi:trypco2 family protein [Streptomyces hyaluromycini]|uniref:Trypco2 family protein n=1 Tax=Streptomyces hyaluromycini TaxID=1377993 RepID=A0ABV1WR45_9ACTN